MSIKNNNPWKINPFNPFRSNGNRRNLTLNASMRSLEGEEGRTQDLEKLIEYAQMLENEADIEAGEKIESQSE